MSEMPSLQKLVVAISSAVLQAQEKVEAAQLNNLMSYFRRKPGEKGFFPITMKINLPSARPEAKPGDTDAYRVPYLSVLPYSALRIKQVDVDFDVAFSGLTGPVRNGEESGLAEEDARALEGSADLPDIAIDMGAIKSGASFMAHVRMSLEGVDLPEGTARLVNELIKTSQIYEPLPEPETPPSGAENTGNGDANAPRGRSRYARRRDKKRRGENGNRPTPPERG